MAKLNDVVNPVLGMLGAKSDLFVHPESGDMAHRIMHKDDDPKKYHEGYSFYDLQRDQARADAMLKKEIAEKLRTEVTDHGIGIVLTLRNSNGIQLQGRAKLVTQWEPAYFPYSIAQFKFSLDTWEVSVSTSGGPKQRIGTARNVYQAHAIVRAWLARIDDEPILGLIK